MRQLKITKQITHRNEDSINRYFQEISKYHVLSVEEEVDLTLRIKKGEQVALEKLVLANLRFVVSVAKQYQNQGLSFPDLINEGNVGLVKAASKFDETRGFKFISYAVWWIRQSIIQAISEQTRIVRLPLNRISSINKIAKASPYLEQEFERTPTEAELSEHLDISDSDIKIANDINKRQLSFDMPLKNDNESESTLYDVIQTNTIPSPDNQLMEESLSKNILRALRKLSQREAEIITMSFGLGGKKSLRLHDIALEFNMTTERIRQIKARALYRLKIILKDKLSLIEN
ncbi:MAG: RNA polymerase sigma factor RpoD/SigA [Bacteroidetes bacterium]|nr:RNA polymerase sigma factor RpoD/SigA [Bacteroidota bacterium]